MCPKERELKRKEQSGELYKSIGKFTVEFEHVTQALEFGIIFMFEKNSKARLFKAL